MRRREFLVGAALLAGSMARSRAADIPAPSPEGLDRITAYFDNEVASGRLPGAVILVQQHGKPVYLKTFGVRDTRTGLAMTPDTIFAIHSMTKPITCLGAMMLIDEGKLALTDAISKYVPLFADTKVGIEVTLPDGKLKLDLVPPVRPVNIEDLLRHTSGISYDYIGAPWVEQVYSAADIFQGQFNNREFADRIAKLPLTRQPGTLWRYGHSTDVLGAIIEIISGQTLYDYLKQRILDPLGMSSTKFALATEEELARMARPLPNDFILLAGERDRLDHPEWQSGGGGLLSTIIDYQRFSQMLLNGGEFEGKRYLSPSAFKAMTTDHIGPGSGVGRDYFYFPGDGFGYGYGIGVRTDPGNAKPPPAGSIGELKWDSGSGTYFGVDPKLDMVYLMMQQTQNERSRITPAFKELVYGCYPEGLRRP
ncbi:serine hydrolase [Bradyrhizobium sacchari]|uniref:CubicO group peptidase (Beta-lactamase class C family) n=1 Tax=Bradyrhizobium sacchari TaxID=1399419 RepID=A0A560K5A9_9BRAD|nr:serine hydrolase domain-containing protein [Bradyrhizobium sacchari]OPY99960.1 serine hydrolase [Bradyrhizobium sacchari]TWB54024.1 CubicO group peptidase (beta-lactamase class C family) [Bradyrhizobium sacchari]TWB78472.1 CubicO group peptidase (beta-lactamase class C family) [Bradyrhizobium sacchari]